MSRQVGGTTQVYPVSIVGKKGLSFFSRVSFASVVASVVNLPSVSKFSDLVGCVKSMLDMFVSGRVSVVYLAHNSFINTMSQKPYLYQLLPIVEERSSTKKLWDYLYEPSAEELLSILFIRYVESLIYQGFIENQACEQAARMVAMKSATENANEVVERFTLVYNKERQAVITRELSEIVAGAAAV
jgi:F-type H+-transporting ATPase subunit gamma